MLNKIKDNLINLGINQLKNIFAGKFSYSIFRTGFSYAVNCGLYHVLSENPKNMEQLLKFGDLYDNDTIVRLLSEIRQRGRFSNKALKSFMTEFSVDNNMDLIMYCGNFTFVRITRCVEREEFRTGTTRTLSTIVISFYGKMAYRLMKRFRYFESKAKKESAGIYTLSNSRVDMINDLGDEYREKDSVIIPDVVYDQIIKYLKNSLHLADIMHKKVGAVISPGILFYGDPGTGKSSMIEVIAREFACDIFYMDVSDIYECRNLIADEIYRSGLTRRKIFVFEDIDIVAPSRDVEVDLPTKRIEESNNFNILLQILDGYLSRPGVIKIATTNHIDKLDPALIRFGRFDLKIKMEEFDREMAEKMCHNFNISTELLDLVSFPINPAELQACIMENYQKYKLPK